MSVTDNDARTFLRQLFRKPLVNKQYQSDWIPRDPSDSWASVRLYWGYDYGNAELSEREVYGMVKKVQSPSQSGPSDYFALLSLRGDHDMIPPHPGHGPDYLNDYTHPDLVFSDGSLGCWDPRYFPQLYDRRRPWIGYHALTLPSNNNRHAPENWRAVEYYDFLEERVPFTGGRWRISEIDALLRRRASIEADLLPTLINLREALLKHYGAFLPYFDPLTVETVHQWQTWPDGRDSIGRTQRYIAELVALRHWLNAVQNWPPKGGTKSGVTGIWIGTVSNDADWEFLRQSQLPLFTLVPVPPQHRYCQIAIVGDLDNWERNRVNSLDFVLNRTTRNVSQFRSQLLPWPRRNKPNYGSLPSSIRKPMNFPSPNQYSKEWDLPYSSYLLNYCPPKQPPLQILKQLRKAHERENRASRSPPILPPNAILQKPNPHTHPILAVLPNIRSPGNQATHFTEEEENGFAWAEWVSRSRLKKQRCELENQYRFYFEIGDHLFLWANNPLPDDPTGQFGRITQLDDDSDEDDELKEEVVYKVLKYVREKPSNHILYGEYETTGCRRISLQQLGHSAQPQTGGPLYQADFDFASFRQTVAGIRSAQSKPGTHIDEGTTSQSQGPSNMVPDSSAQVGTDELAIDMVSNPCGRGRKGASQTPRSHGDDSCDSNVTPESSDKSTEQGDLHRAVESQDLRETSVATTPAIAHLTLENFLENPLPATMEDTISVETIDHITTTQPSDSQPISLLPSLPPPVPLSALDRLLEQMHYQRSRASSFLSCRLCLTFASPTLIAPFVTCSTIPSTNLICYPIRLSNVSLALSVPMIYHITQRDQWGEVVAISSIREPDSTITVDIGFRFPDDALAMCTRDGIKFEGRYIHVQPITQLQGLCFFPNLTFSTTASGRYAVRTRCERLNAYTTLEEAIDVTSPLITQMVNLFTRLSEQLNPEPPARSGNLTDYFPSLLEAHTPLQAIQKILPPSKLPRTIFISRHIDSIPTSINETSPSPPAISIAFQEDELQFDHVIPNRPIPRRTRQRLINRETVDDPSSVTSMNARERFEALRLIFKFATEKYRVWNSQKIPLSPPPDMVDDVPGEKLITNLVSVWKWYDDAYKKATSARDEVLADPQSPFPLIEAYDTAVDAFSLSTRRFGVYGAEYDALQEALLNLSRAKDDVAMHD